MPSSLFQVKHKQGNALTTVQRKILIGVKFDIFQLVCQNLTPQILKSITAFTGAW